VADVLVMKMNSPSWIENRLNKCSKASIGIDVRQLELEDIIDEINFFFVPREI
jgi:hypothetical protein